MVPLVSPRKKIRLIQALGMAFYVLSLVWPWILWRTEGSAWLYVLIGLIVHMSLCAIVVFGINPKRMIQQEEFLSWQSTCRLSLTPEQKKIHDQWWQTESVYRDFCSHLLWVRACNQAENGHNLRKLGLDYSIGRFWKICLPDSTEPKEWSSEIERIFQQVQQQALVSGDLSIIRRFLPRYYPLPDYLVQVSAIVQAARTEDGQLFVTPEIDEALQEHRLTFERLSVHLQQWVTDTIVRSEKVDFLEQAALLVRQEELRLKSLQVTAFRLQALKEVLPG